MDERLMAIAAGADSGHYDAAKSAIENVLPEALAVDYPLTHARAHDVAGRVASVRGEYDAAVASHTEAFRIALAIGADRLAARAAIALVLTEGLEKAQFDKGEAWTTIAKALAERVDPGGMLYAKILNAEGVLRHRQARHEEAIANFNQAIEIIEGMEQNESMDLGHAHNHLGASLDELRRFGEAEGHFRRALAIAEAEYGPKHPGITASLGNLALNMQFQGRHEEALELQKRVLAIRTAALPSDHASIALTHNNMGWTLFEMQEPEKAARHFEQAIEIFEQTFGPAHARVGMAVEGLASMRSHLGQLDEAEALHERAMKIRIAAVGPDHPNVASSHVGLADVYSRGERFEDALTEVDAALAILEKQPENAIRFLIDALHQRGMILIHLQRVPEARASLERCVSLLDADHPTAKDGVIRFGLANALFEDGDKDKAFEVAKQARALIDDPEQLADIDAFLAR
jgi:tetratricopeptide (TPR) repeat protein